MCECRTGVCYSQYTLLIIIEYLDGIELLIIIVATFGQAVSASSLKVDVFGILIAWRFFVSIDHYSRLMLWSSPLYNRWGWE